MMKTKALLLSALVALTLVACQKENNGFMRLTIEGMNNDTKMAVNANVSYWAEGDEVRINENTVTISGPSISNNTATTSIEVESADAYYGVYPAGIYCTNNGASYTLDLPATYTYATTTRQGHTYQNLQTPMVGYTTGSSMQFKHVTAALNVKVVNDFGIDIRVTNITISSNKYQLRGTTTITVNNAIDVVPVAAEGDGNAALRQVQMTFGATQLIIPSGSSAIVQVPVLPVDNDNRFTISVTVQNKDDADMTYTFSKTQVGNSTDGYALGRAMLGYAPAKFGGVFTTSASGTKVRFSPGNLQYNISANIWSFISPQYGMVETASQNVGTDYANQNIVSLFAWGTSGWNNGNAKYMPYNTANSGYINGYGYGPTDGSTYTYSLTDAYANSDWGVYNAISNGGNLAGIWRTPTANEWSYIISTRTTGGTVNGTVRARYTHATVKGVNGILLFPDEFVSPTFTQGSSWGTINEKSDYSTTINSSDWELLEVAGVVFLPAAGYRSTSSVNANTGSYGSYWSSTCYNATYPYRVYYYSNSMTANDHNGAKNAGCSVRLVREIN